MDEKMSWGRRMGRSFSGLRSSGMANALKRASATEKLYTKGRPSARPPRMHIYVERQKPWFGTVAELPSHAGFGASKDASD